MPIDRHTHIETICKTCLWSLILAHDAFSTRLLYWMVCFARALSRILLVDLNLDAEHALRIIETKHGIPSCDDATVDTRLEAALVAVQTPIVTTLHSENVLAMFGVKHVFLHRPVIHKNRWSYPMWHAIHLCALSRPLQYDMFMTLMESLAHIVPCVECAAHAREFLGQNQVTEFSHDPFLFTSRFHQASKSQPELGRFQQNQMRNMYMTRSEDLIKVLAKVVL